MEGGELGRKGGRERRMEGDRKFFSRSLHIQHTCNTRYTTP